MPWKVRRRKKRPFAQPGPWQVVWMFPLVALLVGVLFTVGVVLFQVVSWFLQLLAI